VRGSWVAWVIALVLSLVGSVLVAPQAQAYSPCTGTGSFGTHCYGNISENDFPGNYSGHYASAIFATIDTRCSYVASPSNDMVNTTIWAGTTNGSTFEIGEGTFPGYTRARFWYTTRYGGGYGYGEWDSTDQAYDQVGYAASISWSSGGNWTSRANGKTYLTATGPNNLINTAQAGAEVTNNSNQAWYDIYGIGRRDATTGASMNGWPGADLVTYYNSPPMLSTPTVINSGEVASHMTAGMAC
jgi:hypothetical protein